MKKAAQIPSYKLAELLNLADNEKDFEFYRFEYFLNEREHLKHPHRHDHFAIFMITSGTGTHLIDFRAFEIKPGRIFLLAPGQVHAWQQVSGVKGFVLLFTAEFFTLTLQYRELRAYLFNNFIYQHAFLDPGKQTAAHIQHIFKNIERELAPVKKHTRNIIRSYINIILFELTRVYEQSIPIANEKDVVHLKVLEFEMLVGKNFKSMHAVTDYALQLNITANYLNAICIKRRDVPAGQVIRDRIMLEARRLLAHSDLSIAQIAYELGFEDNSYFGRFFKKYSNQTPAAFRSTVKKEPLQKPVKTRLQKNVKR
jgi:AraC-like DNA-binding protein/mannose-6-phosphate isomerase-like protein (cupin superfamily)